MRRVLGVSIIGAMVVLFGAACGGAPRGIVYKVAPADVNARAEAFLLEVLGSAGSAQALAAKAPLLCGPFLWARLRGHADVAAIDKGVMKMMIPDGGRVLELEGKMFQDAEEVRAFWRAFFASIQVAPFSIRAMDAEEKEIYWALIAWDIEEPIFIVEGNGYELVVDITVGDDGSFSVFWIDDISKVGIR